MNYACIPAKHESANPAVQPARPNEPREALITGEAGRPRAPVAPTGSPTHRKVCMKPPYRIVRLNQAAFFEPIINGTRENGMRRGVTILRP